MRRLTWIILRAQANHKFPYKRDAEGVRLEGEAKLGASLEAQWLRLCASTAGGTSSISGRGTKSLHAARCGEKKR